MKYSLWQYPIMCVWLVVYLFRIRFKISAVIKWRQEIGILPKDKKPTMSDIFSFAHWAVGQSLLYIW